MTAPFEDIWRVKIRGCSFRGHITSRRRLGAMDRQLWDGQSVDSKGVKELEGQLGCPLLERHACMRSTETGAVLLCNAQRLTHRS